MKTKTKVITWALWSLSILGASLVYFSIVLIVGGS